jgi:predicted transcriptional regulator
MQTITIRISKQTAKRLDEICEASGYTRSQQIESMIDVDYEDWQARPTQPTNEIPTEEE